LKAPLSTLPQTKKGALRDALLYLSAEKEGFEPPVPCGTTVFKTAALDRSAISPGAKVVKFLLLEIHFKKNRKEDFTIDTTIKTPVPKGNLWQIILHLISVQLIILRG
jgi:hypothetical protein